MAGLPKDNVSLGKKTLHHSSQNQMIRYPNLKKKVSRIWIISPSWFLPILKQSLGCWMEVFPPLSAKLTYQFTELDLPCTSNSKIFLEYLFFPLWGLSIKLLRARVAEEGKEKWGQSHKNDNVVILLPCTGKKNSFTLLSDVILVIICSTMWQGVRQKKRVDKNSLINFK